MSHCASVVGVAIDATAGLTVTRARVYNFVPQPPQKSAAKARNVTETSVSKTAENPRENALEAGRSMRSQLSVAPMMEWTDRHCRYFLRGFSPSALLYT